MSFKWKLPSLSSRSFTLLSNVELAGNKFFNNKSLIELLRCCRDIKNLKLLTSVLTLRGLVEDGGVLRLLIKTCFQLGAPELALAAFVKIKTPSIALQNVMVKNLCNCGLYEDVLRVYYKCRRYGCPSDNFTFPYVLKASSALGATEVGKQIHLLVLTTGFEQNLVIQTALVYLYATSGSFKLAYSVLDRIPEPDLVCWNALIAGYASNGFNQEALDIFNYIRAIGFKHNISTLASIIPVCTRLGFQALGKSVHGLAVKSGLLSTSFLVPALISMYADDVDISLATNLFDSAVQHDPSLWNSMISAYVQRKQYLEAAEMFLKMLGANLLPNLVTFVSLLPICETTGSTSFCKSLHARVMKQGLENKFSMITALVSMYGKLGDVVAAKSLFDKVSGANILSLNSMVSAYTHNGLWEEGLTTFLEMQFAGLEVDAVSIVNILSACNKLGAILLGISVHAISIKKGFDSNIDVSNALLSFYFECCQISTCFNIFYKMKIRDTVSWNTLLSGCVHCKDSEKANLLFCQMLKEGMEMDFITLISILPIYCTSKHLAQGKATHGYANKSGLASCVSVCNALISMYGNCGDLNAATLLFEVMPEKDLVSFNALLTGFRCQNLHNEALHLFRVMIEDNHRPNDVTMLNMLPVCDTLLHGKSIHAYAFRSGVLEGIPFTTSLIFMYARFNIMKSCLLLFQMGDKRDVSLWNAIMSAHVQLKEARRAVFYFHKLLQWGLQPDHINVLNLISACIRLSSTLLTHSVMAFTICKGFDKDVAVSNALIDMQGQCGNILYAKRLFDRFAGKDSVSWNVMIHGYGLLGDGQAAFDLFLQMQNSCVKPDGVTYSSILSVCSHTGLVEQAHMVLESMVRQGISLTEEHYACMVDLLGRAGYLNEAYSILKRMRLKPSVSMLESLVSACRLQGNIKLGEEVGRLLVKRDSNNSTSYVMLHNVYAAAGRWEDAYAVRSDMDGRRLRKIPGSSLLTIKHSNAYMYT